MSDQGDAVGYTSSSRSSSGISRPGKLAEVRPPKSKKPMTLNPVETFTGGFNWGNRGLSWHEERFKQSKQLSLRYISFHNSSTA